MFTCLLKKSLLLLGIIGFITIIQSANAVRRDELSEIRSELFATLKYHDLKPSPNMSISLDADEWGLMKPPTNQENLDLYKKQQEEGIKMFVIFGYPGAGKGTFSEILQERGYKHLSTGDILREEVRLKTSIGVKYKKEIESSSSLLPEEIIQEVVLKKLVALLQTEEKVVLDGFPKTLEQAQHLDHLFKTHSLHKNVKFVYLDVPLEIASERIIGRRTCSSCGKLYNLITAKPINPDMCDVCQHPLIQRSCDNEQDFQKRIVLFNQTVKKVIDFYETQGILLRINFDISLEHLKKCLTTQSP